MNRLRKTIITAAVALTTVAMIAPASVGAVTIAELQAQIIALTAQLSALQSSSTTTSGMPVACAGVSLTRNLAVGATGSDVKCLQAAMNALGYTVASSGAGSPGNETTTFGPRTLGAVQKFQVAKFGYSAGQVGPLTRAELNAWLGGAPAPTPGPGPTPVPTGAGLTVMLASNNPASGSVVGVSGSGSALNPILRLTFLNGDNAEVMITGLKLKRIGISADASVTNAYLFDGAVRLTDGSAVSTTVVNFNNSAGLFKVPAGGSKTISVLADIDGSASETVGFQLVSASDVTSNSSSVKGFYPLTGNLMTIADATLAGVNFNATTTPAAASVDPQDGYTVWQNSTVVTTRAVDLTRITFRRTGSVKNTDLQNFKLYIDGMQVGSSQQMAVNSNAENVVTFDLTGSPKRLEAGTRIIKLLADIVGGSSLTFTMHLWNVADATFVDSQYLANVLAQANSATFTKRSSGEQTVNSGTLTITKMTNSPSGDIVDGANNVTLAKFEFKAAGEKIKVENLILSAVVSTAAVDSLRNGAVYANGVQIGSTTTLKDNGAATPTTTYNFGSSLIVEPGSPVTVEVKADIFDNDGTNSIVSGTTIIARLEGASTNNNGTGLVSATTLDVPSSDTDGNTLTVKQGSLALSKYPSYTNQTAVPPLTAYKIGHYSLTAATSESVNLTAINVAVDETSSFMTNLYVKYGTVTSSVKPTLTNTNTWSINHNLAAGSTIDVMVYADVNSSATGTGTVDLDIDGTTASSAVSADSSVVTGQSIVYSTGSFTADFASTPQNQTVSGNQEVEIGRWKWTSSYQNYTITEIKIDPDVSTNSSDNAEDVISSVTLWDGSLQVGQAQSFNNIDTNGSTGGYYFTGLSVPVAASTVKTLAVKATLGIPSTTAGNSGLRIVPSLTFTKYQDPQGTVTEIDADDDGNSTYVYRTVPTISQIDLTNNAIANGQVVDMYKFKVTAPAQGDVFVKQFKLDLSWSDVNVQNLEVESIKLLKDGVDITASVSIVGDDGQTAESTTGVTESDASIVVTWDGTTEDTIGAGASTTYTIRGTPQDFDSVSGSKDSVALTYTTDAADVTFGSATVDFIGFINVDSPSIGTILGLYTAAAANAAAEDAQLIWSDGSAVAHSASTTAGTGDWTNSYLIKDSLTSEVWSK